MIGDDFQQTNSKRGTAYQAKGNITVHGLTYTDARQIAIDLWKANAIELSEQAAQKAYMRVEEFFEAFIIKVNSNNAESLGALNEPDMQMALYSAQKDYAKTGDMKTGGLLIEFLADRAVHPSRDLEQIIIDESLNAVPKLTSGHIDLLSLILMVRSSKELLKTAKTHLDLNKLLHDVIDPFMGDLIYAQEWTRHLIDTNCLVSSGERPRLAELLISANPSLFKMGIPRGELIKICGTLEGIESIFMPCPHRPGNIQFIADDAEKAFHSIPNIAEASLGRGRYWFGPIGTAVENWVDEKGPVNGGNILNTENILHGALPYSHQLLSIYRFVQNNEFTAVGRAIAKANIKHKIGLDII